ncbi:MAG: alpha/beta hydrolase [Acidobacteria bacterium]|nr:alpha/beta hydrolase [Acidobacteriota bacterium]
MKLEPHIFEAANNQKVDAELGHLFVPENRRNPNSRLIELVFVRFKSTAPNPGPPIVYLAGGPGGSGIGAARGSRFPLFMAMREIADVIAIDQRGTGLSKPNLECQEKIDLPIDKAPNREEVLDLFRKQSRSCAQRWREQGVDLAGYNTNENADDLDALRKALGAEKISLWAISYGTHLGLTTIRRHEKNIHRAILAGIEGPAHTIKLPSNVQQHLINLDKLVKADPNLSKDIPDLLGLMKTVLDRVEREPVTVEVTRPATQQKVKVTINKFILQYLTTNLFGFGEGLLPRNYYVFSKGDFSGAAQMWLRLIGSRPGIGSAMSFMMDCSSGISPERRRQITREAKETLLGEIIDFPFLDVCDAWGNPDLGEDFRKTVKSTVPALFISGTLDVRTPVSNAEEVRQGFRDSQHLIIEGAVHSDPLFLSSPKIKDVMLEFMKGEPLSTTRIVLQALKFMQVTEQKSN